MSSGDKIKALAEYLECDVDDVEAAAYGENEFDVNGETYLVLNDIEADAAAHEQIMRDLWAFRPSFLECYMDIPEVAITSIAESMCEDASEVFEQLIHDVDNFVEDAILSDGRGHFLSFYDGEENEHGEFYIYRTN